jgi:hypothetical protein
MNIETGVSCISDAVVKHSISINLEILHGFLKNTGAHGRFTPSNGKRREARIQTLEPEPWMYEVEKYGHATRKVTQLSALDV